MDTDDKPKPLDYATPEKRDPEWFRILVIAGCVLGVLIILGIVVDSIRYR